ncbi:LysR family transcriptional regulator [Acinetobacter guillouiae]|uniref:LysR family transcriptional regulator n=1 Tax=Acinetobacter guillouiae TaxID=106649 RepID=UPI0028D3924A|nr:LysR family transcriptional regulator [Acinetobacter guillouiae]
MVDLNLIRAFVTIYNTRSVSTAAVHLNITQPSVSHNLSRLRYLFKDQLFIRTKEGMIPTTYATQLYEALNHHLVEIEGVVSEVKNFDAKTSERCFSNVVPLIRPLNSVL